MEVADHQVRTTRNPLELAISLAANVMAAMYFLYLLVFNFVPEAIRIGVAGSLGGASIALAVLALLHRPSRSGGMMAASLAVMIASVLLGVMFRGFIPDASEVFRFVTPFFAAIWIMAFGRRIDSRLVFSLSAAIIIFALLTQLFAPEYAFRGVVRPESFTGGSGIVGRHASAYATALSMIIVHIVMMQSRRTRTLSVMLLAAGLFVLASYMVRTTLLMILIYFVMVAWMFIVRRSASAFQAAAISLFAVALVTGGAAVVLALMDIAPGEAVYLGSGRAGAYIYRLELLGHRDFGMHLLGSGIGSDDTVVGAITWRHEAKGSHQDFLTMYWELGLIGLIGLCMFFFGLFRATPPYRLGVFLALIAASLVSNGLVYRPSLIVLALLALSLRSAKRPPARVFSPRSKDGSRFVG